MKITYTYPKKNDFIFVTPFIGGWYYNNVFSLSIGFLFWGIQIEF